MRLGDNKTGILKELENGPENIVHNEGDDGKRVDHIVYSSLLAVCSKKMPHSFDVNDESTE
jgi:hypothetical protein